VKQESLKALDATSLGDLFDHRREIQSAYTQTMNRGIPHPKKIIEAMRSGDERKCRLTQGGKSCACRDKKTSAYADQLRDIDSAIQSHLNPVVPNIAREHRDRLHTQARELTAEARQLRKAAEDQVRGLYEEARQLDAKAEALLEQSKSDAHRAIEANGHQFYLERTDDGHRA
jgi:hypothetical protein